jgi:hypothetical protein
MAVIEKGPLIVAYPFKGFIYQYGGVRFFLLPVKGLPSYPDNATVGDNIMGNSTVKHITGGIGTALITGTYFVGIPLPFNRVTNLRYRRKHDILGKIMYFHIQ